MPLDPKNKKPEEAGTSGTTLKKDTLTSTALAWMEFTKNRFNSQGLKNTNLLLRRGTEKLLRASLFGNQIASLPDVNAALDSLKDIIGILAKINTPPAAVQAAKQTTEMIIAEMKTPTEKAGQFNETKESLNKKYYTYLQELATTLRDQIKQVKTDVKTTFSLIAALNNLEAKYLKPLALEKSELQKKGDGINSALSSLYRTALVGLPQASKRDLDTAEKSRPSGGRSGAP